MNDLPKVKTIMEPREKSSKILPKVIFRIEGLYNKTFEGGILFRNRTAKAPL
jgi:hypothetical protein